ncbi:Aste57867_16258 [Aphanomyces stellatus]|uniref:Amino acid transporter n=1 Tax=Aphanomyces stellatus TaxID=120398 RepID=A0A485L532_9STRA|nr:hypothetical protein As57867_016201 [Aphanomyces stellatus]VFT93035.1 Aste57867_16258 [Aphanomyces stellatus]
MAESKPAGILLFTDSMQERALHNSGAVVTPQPHLAGTTPTPSTNSSGKRARNIPYENSSLRTNFKTSSDTSTPQSHIPYHDTDSPILEDIYENKMPPAHTQDAFAHAAPKFSPLAVLAGALVGLGIGAGLYFAKLGPEWQKLVALPGDLFLRALRCLIVPMVFCVMTVVVAEAVSMGRTSILRLTMLLPFFLTSLLATIQGLVLALLFQASFKTTAVPTVAATAAPFNMTMRCANGLFLAVLPTGSVGCVGASAANSTALFLALNQTTNVAATTSTAVDASFSLMDQVVAVADLAVPVNIFESFAEGSLLSIVLFAVPLGLAAAYSAPNLHDNAVLKLIRQFRTIFIVMLGWLLAFTPVAVVFLMAAAVSNFNATNVTSVMSQVGIFFGAFVAGAGMHVLVVLPLVLFAFCRVNPYGFLKHVIPASVFAFGCASSMATLPVALACLQRAHVSRTLAQIAMPFGTSVNLNAAGLIYPLAIVFMATMDGLSQDLTTTRYIVIFFVSLLGCMSTAPVPNASLVYILTLWKTCFPNNDLPASFAFIVAADFINDRISTMVNVNANAVVTRILTDQVDETFEVGNAYV